MAASPLLQILLVAAMLLAGGAFAEMVAIVPLGALVLFWIELLPVLALVLLGTEQLSVTAFLQIEPLRVTACLQIELLPVMVLGQFGTAEIPVPHPILLVTVVLGRCGTLADPSAVPCGMEHQADTLANASAKPCTLDLIARAATRLT